MINEDYYESYEDYKEDKRVRSMTPLQMVREFATTMGQPLDQPCMFDEDYDPELEGLRFGFICEEFQEFEDAPDKENQLKELCDMVYVCFGYAATYGWDMDGALADTHRNSMERCIWPDGTIHRSDEGKILKNPDHPKLSLEKYV
tara:strand:+ start:233 stop:667 length:435 start_codon:yes stop_codon:yes gene_type:complete